MAHYRRRPFFVEAIQFAGTNGQEIAEFMGYEGWYEGEADEIIVEAPEGNMRAQVGDYIVKDGARQYYPCKSDVFERSHELLPDPMLAPEFRGTR